MCRLPEDCARKFCLISEYCSVICLEFLDSGVSQRMMKHLLQNLIGNCRDICSGQSALCYMDRMTNACSDDLCLDSCYREHIGDLTDQRKSVCGDVIQSAKERGYICSACSCSQKSLVCGEDQGYVCLDAFFGKNFNCFQSLSCHRDLNNHVGMDLGDLAALCDHTLSVCCGSFYLSADRSVNDRCDLFDNLVEISSLFCDQRRIGGYSADDSHVVCLTDVFHIGCVNKKFHCFSLL